MVSSIGWSQFLTWACTGLAVYALLLVLFFYRDTARRLFSSVRTGGGQADRLARTIPTTNPSGASGVSAASATAVPDVMGKPRTDQRSGATPSTFADSALTASSLTADGPGGGAVPEQCANCGHPLPERPRSYDEAPEASDERRSTTTTPPPPYIDVVTREDNVDGYVDLDDLEALIERTSALVETSRAGQEDVTQAKRRLAAALASDELLNSTDFARQVAVTLDREAPTGDFSAVSELDRQAA